MTAQLSDTEQLAIVLKNAVGFSLRESSRNFSLPRYLTVGISSTRYGVTLAADSEYGFGTFGGVDEHRASIWLLRVGVEKRLVSPWVVRAGLIYPAIVRTSALGDMTEDIPWPKVSGSLGMGAAFDWIDIDITVYGDPAMSYIDQRPTAAAEVTVTLKF